ncbi:hypothetical protein G7Y29_10310 [Corynebacterium qintianiae]|uniref:Uncharacterized protein n=1 Tax=Corynebacterium qintianiae TaxID=2709392 RepID=A0A7T0KMT5_9CORY|nr:hypothetical protein [Corynebacterium qintianiae]QPK83199.1 hypothetical protein G7Y29_10310 [Corynebacterium qintianiae]
MATNNNTTGNQDITLGIILVAAGVLAIVFAWGAISYLTAIASFSAGGWLVARGVGKNR